MHGHEHIKESDALMEENYLPHIIMSPKIRQSIVMTRFSLPAEVNAG
jgi:hypothetical protein